MTIVFATNNAHKLQEVRHILGSQAEILSLDDIGCHDDIPETGTTLEENALQKAQYIWQHYHCSVFADDTGLEVDALGGAPGVYSARYAALAPTTQGLPAGKDHDSEANMARLLSELGENNNRKARFRTVIAFLEKRTDGNADQHLFEGVVEGTITRQRSGAGGFGYDPIFRPDGYDGTFADLGEDVKNGISHRGRATAKLCAYLSGR